MSKRRPWQQNEVKAVEKHLKKYIAIMKVPGKNACMEAIRLEPCLEKRGWRNVKYFIKNQINTRQRKTMKKK